jgi:hypothetical protein
MFVFDFILHPFLQINRFVLYCSITKYVLIYFWHTKPFSILFRGNQLCVTCTHCPLHLPSASVFKWAFNLSLVSGSVGGLDSFDRLSMMYKLKEIRVIRVTKAKHCVSVVQLSRRHFNAKILENTVSGTETENSSGSPEFNTFFTRVRVVQSLVFYVVCFQILFVSLLFSFVHCIISLLRITTSDYPCQSFSPH